MANRASGGEFFVAVLTILNIRPSYHEVRMGAKVFQNKPTTKNHPDVEWSSPLSGCLVRLTVVLIVMKNVMGRVFFFAALIHSIVEMGAR